jgi:hypothetical protein
MESITELLWAKPDISTLDLKIFFHSDPIFKAIDMPAMRRTANRVHRTHGETE